MSKSINKPLFYTFTALVLLSLSSAQAKNPSLSKIPSDPQHTIKVSGKGVVATAPDYAIYSLNLLVSSDDLDALKIKYKKAMDNLTGLLQDLGIDKKDILINARADAMLENQNYRGNPISSKFKQANLIKIKLDDFNKIEALTIAIAELKGIAFLNIEYRLKDSHAAKEKALAQAMSNAHDKAKQLAQLGGLTLGKITGLTSSHQDTVSTGTENYYSTSSPYSVYRSNLEEPIYAAGTLVVKQFITVSFAVLETQTEKMPQPSEQPHANPNVTPMPTK